MPKKLEQVNISQSYKTAEPSLDLLDFMKMSYEDVVEAELEKLFKTMFPIEDKSGSKFLIEFVSMSIDPPLYTEDSAFEKITSYNGHLKVTVKFHNKKTGVVKKDILSFGMIPKMTSRGTFIEKGLERVIVSRIVRAQGLMTTLSKKRGVRCFGARVVPEKGPHIIFDSDADGNVYVSVDVGMRVPTISFLRYFGYTTKESMLALFAQGKEQEIIGQMYDDDPYKTREEYMRALYKVFYKTEPTTADGIEKAVERAFSDIVFDLGPVSRMSINTKTDRAMNPDEVEKHKQLDAIDFVNITRKIIEMNNDPESLPDNVDHLGNRRVRLAGELFLMQAQRQLYAMAKRARDRASSLDPSLNPDLSAGDILHSRSFAIAVRDFYNNFSDMFQQRNPLDSLEHNRTFTLLGLGGLTRQQASVQVRDLHQSHYGRICPINTPESQSVGLVLHPALYSRVNRYGFLETPYIKVVDGVITDQIDYLTADQDDKYRITYSGVKSDEKGKILSNNIEVRYKQEYHRVSPEEIDYIEVSTSQMFSMAACLVPLLQHNLMIRGFYGANMQKQALCCFHPEAPLVATGLESKVAEASGRIVRCEKAGTVTSVDARHIVVTSSSGAMTYPLTIFKKGNGKTFTAHHRPSVSLGDKVAAGDILAENYSTADGQVALGKNLRVAFLCADGATYEDSIVVSERLVYDDVFTSVQVQEHVIDVRDTKLGPEETTYDIANASSVRLRNLDEEGIAREGSLARPGDVLVGRVSPRGEVQFSPEEKLLQSIFGNQAKDMKDNSLRLPPGQQGRVINVKVFRREDNHDLRANVNKQVRVTVADIRKIEVGDKMANRHGNKGVISKILPVEDMPYTADGEPIDIILTPLGVPTRQNPGQLLEMYLGHIAKVIGKQIVIPPAARVDFEKVVKLAHEGGVKDDKETLYDGQTGEPFSQKVAVGYMYMMKLDHMVTDKIHMRSTGPYVLVSQQPTQGRSKNGGQRVGEMEVWAMLAHGAAHNLQESMTYKSDDITGRFNAYNAIVKNRPITYVGTPAAFNVLLAYLKALSLNIDLKRDEDE